MHRQFERMRGYKLITALPTDNICHISDIEIRSEKFVQISQKGQHTQSINGGDFLRHKRGKFLLYPGKETFSKVAMRIISRIMSFICIILIKLLLSSAEFIKP